MNYELSHNRFRQLPGVDRVLNTETCSRLIEQYGKPVVTYAVRSVLDRMRNRNSFDSVKISPDSIAGHASEIVYAVSETSLKPVINATGIILHTNLGRAPLGDNLISEIAPVLKGYSNLEFDLKAAKRGHRIKHISELLCYLSGASGAVVVNNNAAGIILALNTLARSKEVIISRGELIEIGGAFRIPEIMAASGAKMVEVGTTNRTKLSDYEKAITSQTAAIFKAHKSNYTIQGFTEEVTVKDLSKLAHSQGLPFFYDIGSGLIRKPSIPGFEKEPDVRSAVKDGADLVMFSGDKLLGGSQAGIIVGARSFTDKLSKAPLMRALRVGKLTIAVLESACRHYLTEESLKNKNPLFHFLERKPEKRKDMADTLVKKLSGRGVKSTIVNSFGFCGGGTLPELKLSSDAVMLIPPSEKVKERQAFSEKIFHNLLQRKKPVLGVLREGRVLFDMFALEEKEIEEIASAVADCIGEANEQAPDFGYSRSYRSW